MKRIVFGAVILIAALIYALNVLSIVLNSSIKEHYDVREQIKMEMLIQ